MHVEPPHHKTWHGGSSTRAEHRPEHPPMRNEPSRSCASKPTCGPTGVLDASEVHGLGRHSLSGLVKTLLHEVIKFNQFDAL